MIDCLFIGHNDGDFAANEKLLKAMGRESGAFRDLNLNYFSYEGQPYRAMDILNHFRFSGEKKPKIFYNGDYLNLTIAYLGSYIAARGFTFDHVNTFHLEKEQLKKKLVPNNIGAIIIPTTLYVTAQPVDEIIRFVREYNDTAKIIVGGPFIFNQVYHTADEQLSLTFQYLDADYYVCSPEGEATLAKLLQALKEGKDTAHIPNLVYKADGQYVKTPTAPEDNDLDENPINWNLFAKKGVGDFIAMRTAKSCPFSCAFCGFPMRAGSYKCATVATVEQQLNMLKEIGTVKSISFIDDTFNVPPKRFKEILRMMIKNDYGFKWNSYFRCQYADREMVELMKESGCEGVYLGIESGSDEILRNMNKQAAKEAYVQGLQFLNEFGILSHASFIIGFPGETQATVQETIDFIEAAKPTFFRTQLWYCDHLTPIYGEKERYQITGSGFSWAHQTMDSGTACDWIDHIFQTVQNSLWLPQNSFDYLSLYYLQTKGMKLPAIKEFAATFNLAVKQKLRSPAEPIANELIDRLKALSQFEAEVS